VPAQATAMRGDFALEAMVARTLAPDLSSAGLTDGCPEFALTIGFDGCPIDGPCDHGSPCALARTSGTDSNGPVAQKEELTARALSFG
jgi:hypothetical protein